ncbi:hypothetical protein SUGI_0598140 [Cryptomeria japonica]|nr:hypothetical protein SUGI_0598140 [Cryptomeria japonica]
MAKGPHPKGLPPEARHPRHLPSPAPPKKCPSKIPVTWVSLGRNRQKTTPPRSLHTSQQPPPHPQPSPTNPFHHCLPPTPCTSPPPPWRIHTSTAWWERWHAVDGGGGGIAHPNTRERNTEEDGINKRSRLAFAKGARKPR